MPLDHRPTLRDCALGPVSQFVEEQTWPAPGFGPEVEMHRHTFTLWLLCSGSLVLGCSDQSDAVPTVPVVEDPRFERVKVQAAEPATR